MSEEAEQRIAKVRGTFLGFEDHGFLTATLDFDYGGAGQGIGSRVFGLDSEKPEDGDKWDDGHRMGMDFVRRIMLACGVDQWEKLKGRTVLVTATHTEIQKIDPLPTETGVPFDIKAWAGKWTASAA